MAANGAAGIDGMKATLNWRLGIVNKTKAIRPIKKTFLSCVFIEIKSV
jgi:hypothetical protein